MKPLPSKQILCSLLDYNPLSGELTWKPRGIANWDARFANKTAFTANDGLGYKCGTLLGENYKAHQIIWAMIHGTYPEEIDHIDHDRSNNRLDNLREATSQTNRKNQTKRLDNTSGHTGVVRSKNKKKWIAQIHDGSKVVYLGTFETLEAAIDARKAAEKLYNYHPNHGAS